MGSTPELTLPLSLLHCQIWCLPMPPRCSISAWQTRSSDSVFRSTRMRSCRTSSKAIAWQPSHSGTKCSMVLVQSHLRGPEHVWGGLSDWCVFMHVQVTCSLTRTTSTTSPAATTTTTSHARTRPPIFRSSTRSCSSRPCARLSTWETTRTTVATSVSGTGAINTQHWGVRVDDYALLSVARRDAFVGRLHGVTGSSVECAYGQLQRYACVCVRAACAVLYTTPNADSRTTGWVQSCCTPGSSISSWDGPSPLACYRYVDDCNGIVAVSRTP